MKREMARRQAILCAIAIAFLWSTSWILIKFGLHDIPALTFAGLRYTLACVFLIPFLFMGKRRYQIKALPGRLWLRLIALGLLLYALTQGAMFMALSCLPAVTVNLLWSFSTIVVALLSIIWLAERPTLLQWVGIGLSIVGALLYFYPAGLRTDQYVGLAACIIGVGTNAGAAILGRLINRSAEVSPLVVAIISMAIGSAVLLPVGIVTQGLPRIGVWGWLNIAWLALVNTAFAFTLWNHTLRILSATESSIINGTMIIWIPVLAVVFLGERLMLRQILAIALVAGGTLAVQLKVISRRKRVTLID